MMEEFVTHLQKIGKSENTIRTYCHDENNMLAIKIRPNKYQMKMRI